MGNITGSFNSCWSWNQYSPYVVYLSSDSNKSHPDVSRSTMNYWFHSKFNYQHDIFYVIKKESEHKLSSVTQSCPTLCDPMDGSTPGLPVHHHLPEFTQTHFHWVRDAIQPSHPLVPFSSHLQSFPASGSFPVSQFFTSGGQSIGVSASAISPSNEYSGLISIRMDWFDFLARKDSQESFPTPQF